MKITLYNNTHQSIITRLIVSSQAAGESLAEAMYAASATVACVERHDHILDGKWFVQFCSQEIEIASH